MTREKQSFNLDLFLELNEEYKDKPLYRDRDELERWIWKRRRNGELPT